MPDLIYDRRDEYIQALRAVDTLAKANPSSPDFAPMVAFLREIITTQLASALASLSGEGSAS